MDFQSDEEIERVCMAHANTGCNLYSDIPKFLAEIQRLTDVNAELKLKLEKYESGTGVS